MFLRCCRIMSCRGIHPLYDTTHVFNDSRCFNCMKYDKFGLDFILVGQNLLNSIILWIQIVDLRPGLTVYSKGWLIILLMVPRVHFKKCQLTINLRSIYIICCKFLTLKVKMLFYCQNVSIFLACRTSRSVSCTVYNMKHFYSMFIYFWGFL